MSSFHCIMTFPACQYSRLWLGHCLSVFAVISKALQLSWSREKNHQDRLDVCINVGSFLSFSFALSIFSHELDEVSLYPQLNCDTVLIRNVTVVSGVCVLFWASTWGLFTATINMCPKWSRHKGLRLSGSVHTWLYNTSPHVPRLCVCVWFTLPCSVCK